MHALVSITLLVRWPALTALHYEHPAAVKPALGLQVCVTVNMCV